MPPLAVIVILALAAFRVTRLITQDTITQPFRSRLYGFAWNDDRPTQDDTGFWPTPRAAWRTNLYRLLTCDWCLGVWMSIAVYCVWRFAFPGGDGNLAQGIVAVAAIAGLQGAVAQFVVTAHEAIDDDEGGEHGAS